MRTIILPSQRLVNSRLLLPESDNFTVVYILEDIEELLRDDGVRIAQSLPELAHAIYQGGFMDLLW